MKQPKIIITGTGRAGTTVLVKLLTLLGLPTGFTQRDFNGIHKNGGGLEFYCTGPNQGPQIVKAPQYYNVLPKMAKWYDVKAVIMPIRNLHDSAASRDALPDGEPGSKWNAESLEEQKNHNARVVYQVVRDCAALDIPLIVLDFPRFVNRPFYLWDSIVKVCDLLQINPTDPFVYDQVFHKVMDPAKIKHYK